MKRTTESFSKEVFELTNGEYEVLGEYKNNKTKILIRHNCSTCGNYEWEVSPGNFTRNGNRCPLCKERPNRTTASLKYELKMLVGDEFSLIGEYRGCGEKIILKHNCEKCNNYEFKKITHKFIKNPECPRCAGKLRRTAESFKEEIKSLTNGEYEVLSNYTHIEKKVLIKHLKCGYEWNIKPKYFLEGNRCPLCANNIRKTTEQFKKEIFELVGNEYEILEEYKNSKTKILLKHNCENCDNFAWKVSPHDFLSGVRCPCCKTSKGEREIEKVLKRFSINYKTQYKIKDCKNINPLPFDFAVFDKDGNLKFLIEYQGGQHYGPVEYFGGEENFINLHIRDKIKEEYCNANNIDLFTIPYTRFKDIQVTLEYRLKKYGLLREAA